MDVLKRINELIKLNDLEEAITNLCLKRNINKNKEDSLWYGGTILSFNVGPKRYELAACGIVDACLYEKPEGYQKDTGDAFSFFLNDEEDELELLFDIKDKRNAGDFGFELEKYISNDEELMKLIDGEHDKYVLKFRNNNWWEIITYDDCDECTVDNFTEGLIEIFEIAKLATSR